MLSSVSVGVWCSGAVTCVHLPEGTNSHGTGTEGRSLSLPLTPGRSRLPESHSTGWNAQAASRAGSETPPKLSVCCTGYNWPFFAILIFMNIKSNCYLYMATLEDVGVRLVSD